MSGTILIADPDTDRRREVIEGLSPRVIYQCADSSRLTTTLLDRDPRVIVIAGLANGDSDVIELALLARKLQPAARVILIVGRSSEFLAISALRAGVFDYLAAPVDPVEIVDAITRALPATDDVTDEFEDLV